MDASNVYQNSSKFFRNISKQLIKFIWKYEETIETETILKKRICLEESYYTTLRLTFLLWKQRNMKLVKEQTQRSYE